MEVRTSGRPANVVAWTAGGGVCSHEPVSTANMNRKRRVKKEKQEAQKL